MIQKQIALKELTLAVKQIKKGNHPVQMEYRMNSIQARKRLRTPAGAKSFLRGAKFFELCPIFLNYVQHVFPGGENFSRGA